MATERMAEAHRGDVSEIVEGDHGVMGSDASDIRIFRFPEKRSRECVRELRTSLQVALSNSRESLYTIHSVRDNAL